MIWPHFHRFRVVMEHADAYFEKQPGQKDSRRYYDCILKECRCGEGRLIPHDKRYRTVEVER